MDNERGCGLDCRKITGSLMETSQDCREHARSGHMLTWTSEPESEPERRETEASRLFSSTLLLLLFVSEFMSNVSPA